jgi:hypothetical protein
VPYTLKHTGERRVEFVEAVLGGRPWSRADSDGIVAQIKVKEGDRDVVFQAELIIEEEKDKQGNAVKKVKFKPNKIKTWMGTESDQGSRYIEVGGGRVMTDGQIGRVSTSAWGTFRSHGAERRPLAAWFVCLWLLRLQWALRQNGGGVLGGDDAGGRADGLGGVRPRHRRPPPSKRGCA